MRTLQNLIKQAEISEILWLVRRASLNQKLLKAHISALLYDSDSQVPRTAPLHNNKSFVENF